MKKIILAAIIASLLVPGIGICGPTISRPSVNVPATETQSGILQLATDAEAIAGADTSKALTPAALRAVILDDMPDATLSGTPVVLGVKDKAGNVYYFKAYPTKN